MKIRYFQKGFNYSQDGPGNRLVYHMQGCNMRCPWCANPEGLDISGGTEDTIDDMLDEILRSRPMFFDGGGVTFTGGEPTMQFEPLLELLKKLKAHGVNVAMECNASHPRLRELFGYIDHLMTDFKQPFPDRHRAVVGVPCDTVLSNLKAACEVHPHLIIRIPMINGYNADDEAIAEFSRVLGSFVPEHVRVEPLRYHEYGKVKWEKLGLPYTVENGYITDDQMNAMLSALHAAGVHTIRT